MRLPIVDTSYKPPTADVTGTLVVLFAAKDGHGQSTLHVRAHGRVLSTTACFDLPDRGMTLYKRSHFDHHRDAYVYVAA